MVASERVGVGPADQVLVLMAEGKGRAEARRWQPELGGSVVGEVEYIGLYQIQTSGTTAQDLESAVEQGKRQLMSTPPSPTGSSPRRSP